MTAAGTCHVQDGIAQWHGTPLPPSGQSLSVVYGARLRAAGVADPICVGMGRGDDGGLVVLAVSQDAAGGAIGLSVLDQPPDPHGYELLAACGVRHTGTARLGDVWVVSFQNNLAAHLLNGLLAGFARTGHCIRFFLGGARVDAAIEAGLVQAATARVQAAANIARASARALALAARGGGLRMTCRPPPPRAAEPMGDLVPIGLLARALCHGGTRADEAASMLSQRHLVAHARQGLWPFQSGRLPTATDSALVLLGVPDRDAVRRLDRFIRADGGVVPQLWSAAGGETEMRFDPAVAHWCQPDLATTALVAHLRHRSGLDARPSRAWVRARLRVRGGLFIANPWLLDWCVALALADDPEAGSERAGLAEEIAAGAGDDQGFGAFDPILSTSAAILALAALGRRGRLLRCAQLRLAELGLGTGWAETATPFYSTEIVPGGTPVIRHPALFPVGDAWHAMSAYEDTFGMVGSALRVLALAEPCDPDIRDLPPDAARARAHPRYRQASAAEYVAGHALPPYAGGCGG